MNGSSGATFFLVVTCALLAKALVHGADCTDSKFFTSSDFLNGEGDFRYTITSAASAREYFQATSHKWSYNFELDGDLSAVAVSYHLHRKWDGISCNSGSTGGHYDPTSQCGPASGADCPPTAGGNYTCQEDTAFCEVGDLSGQAGTLVGTYNSTSDKTAFVGEVNAISISGLNPLHYYFGDQDIAGGGDRFASVVFHGSGGARIACTELVPSTTVLAEYEASIDVGSAASSGSFKMVLEYPDDSETFPLLQRYDFNFTLAGDFGAGLKYHLHTEWDGASCSATLGHFDPTFKCGPASNNANSATCQNAPTYSCTENTPQNCEIGDISGKFGNLVGVYDAISDSTQFLGKFGGDFNTIKPDQYGTSSSDGSKFASIVFHRSSDGSRVACGELVETFKAADALIEGATAVHGFCEFSAATAHTTSTLAIFVLAIRFWFQ
mmetsp:Transcript_18617/g.22867  ORF Transcript_18617/g.22867 Transcript_18617/m.22867 type:complete len:438 (+) Transcript_18617:108-1421(+)